MTEIIRVDSTTQLLRAGHLATADLTEAQAVEWATRARHGQPPEKLYRYEGQHPIGGQKWVLWQCERAQ
jgi:hypothetical protein